MRKMQDWSTYT